MSFNKYYKEKDYVESLLKQRKVNNTIKSDLKIIAKYYKSQDKSDEDIEMLIKEMLKKKLTNYNEVLYYKIIDNAITFANKDKNKLIQIDSIPIVKSEMDYITKLELTDLEKKILFTFLVVDKLRYKRNSINEMQDTTGHYFGGGAFSYKLLLDTLQEKITRTYREKGIHQTIKKFNDKGLTRTTNLATVELLFVDDIENCGEIVLDVTDFDMIGLFYDSYVGKIERVECENIGCNELIFKTNNNKKYCDKCRGEIQQSQKNEWKKKNWKKS